MINLLWSSGNNLVVAVVLDISNLSIKLDIISFSFFQLYSQHRILLL